ncbi:MAG: helix-turn-helix transcriptional regulator [Treponema sp.]|nr:helix-turn-helix transcriptional regulator [Treponema sp.]
MPQVLNIFEDVVKVYGVRLRRYAEDLSGLELFDEGLRSRILETHSAGALAESFRHIEAGAIYLIEDGYRCHYCFFRPPESCGENSRYGVIGPWLENPPDDAGIDSILRQNNIPYHLRAELANYLNRIPLIVMPRSWNAMLLTLAGYLYGGPDSFRLYYEGIDLHNLPAAYSPKQEETLSMQIIEERYQNENALLKAIGEGDTKRALQHLSRFRGYTGEHRTEDRTRDLRNGYIILNSLARKAVENSYVHPAHIHAVSDDFARRIETISNHSEFMHLSELMVRRYCGLVKQFSLRGFSPLTRNVINTIDFNLREPLSLKFLAENFNVNPSNLSTQFKQEKGMTLTGYINTKRMEHAASLLRGSGTYIQEVAEQCGFLDINYFSRLFKRHYGLSPREFRKKAVK